MATEWAGNVAELVDHHGEMVFATAHRILGNPQDAEDVFQDIFLKLLRQGPRRRTPDAVRDWAPYLRVMATRRAIDVLRRKKVRPQVQVEDIEGFQTPAHQNPRAQAIRNELAPLLRRAISSLPKRESLIFSLRHFDDFSYEEIAAHLGITTSSVGVILHRARKQLRAFLRPLLTPTAMNAAPQAAVPGGKGR